MVEAETDAVRFWRYALGVYMPEANRATFLAAQEEGEADVPMLLFCLWCGAEGVRLSETAMEAAVGFGAAWRMARVEPLRALRRGWKGEAHTVPPGLSEAARQAVATAEQAVERLQMEHLASLRDGSEGGEDAARANLLLYRRASGIALSDALLDAVSSLDK